MNRFRPVLSVRPLVIVAAVLLSAMSPAEKAKILAPTTDFSAPERWEELPGGSTTNRERFDRDAFSQPSANLSFEERADFFVGNGLFRKVWVSAPSSTTSSDGLGPLYNARACQRCHLKDGRSFELSGSNDVDEGNKGLYVERADGTLVLVPWDRFERVVLDG